jgi:hypothetical protein
VSDCHLGRRAYFGIRAYILPPATSTLLCADLKTVQLSDGGCDAANRGVSAHCRAVDIPPDKPVAESEPGSRPIDHGFESIGRNCRIMFLCEVATSA